MFPTLEFFFRKKVFQIGEHGPLAPALAPALALAPVLALALGCPRGPLGGPGPWPWALALALWPLRGN